MDEILDPSEMLGNNPDMYTFNLIILRHVERILMLTKQEMVRKTIIQVRAIGGARFEQTETKEDPRNAFSESTFALFSVLEAQLDRGTKNTCDTIHTDYVTQLKEEQTKDYDIRTQMRYMYSMRLFSELCGFLYRQKVATLRSEVY